MNVTPEIKMLIKFALVSMSWIQAKFTMNDADP